jgi:hypothetical protein
MASALGIGVGVGATALFAGGLGAASGAFGKVQHDDGFSGRDLGLGAAVTTFSLVTGGILGLTLHSAMAARGVASSPVANALIGAAALGTVAAGYMTGVGITN